MGLRADPPKWPGDCHQIATAVIADVTTSLRDVLNAALAPLGASAEISNLEPPISPTPARVTIFLYEVVEDPSARNRPRQRSESPPDISLRRPSMALLLRYMFTPWGGDRATEQALLTSTMLTFYDGAILSGTQLSGALAGTDQALKLTQAQLSMEERMRIWHALQLPYRLSVIYEVRVVNVDSMVQQVLAPVSRRSLDYARPEAGA